MVFAWRYVLGGSLLLAAILGCVGAYGAFFLQRFAIVALGLSYALNAALVAWIVAVLAFDTIVLWPGAGPYAILCGSLLIAAIALLRVAARAELPTPPVQV